MAEEEALRIQEAEDLLIELAEAIYQEEQDALVEEARLEAIRLEEERIAAEEEA